MTIQVGAQLGGARRTSSQSRRVAVIGAGLGENARAALVTRGLSDVAPPGRSHWAERLKRLWAYPVSGICC